MANNEKAEIVESTKYLFDDGIVVDDESDAVGVTVVSSNGATPYEVTLIGVNWGMMEDITAVQNMAEDGPKAIFDFMHKHILGGTSAVPLKHTTSLFNAIAEYMTQVMNTQKN